MYALSFHQPWGTLVAAGLKTIDIRWRKKQWKGLPIGQRIGIHAARHYDIEAHEHLARAYSSTFFAVPASSIKFGAIIATARLREVRLYNTRSSFESDKLSHLNPIPDINEEGWSIGEYCYGLVFDNVMPMIMYTPGRQGFFKVNIQDPFERRNRVVDSGEQ